MTRYYMARFHVAAPGTGTYADNYEKTFGKKSRRRVKKPRKKNPLVEEAKK